MSGRGSRVAMKGVLMLKKTLALGGYIVEVEAREGQAEDADHLIALTEVFVHDPQHEVPV